MPPGLILPLQHKNILIHGTNQDKLEYLDYDDDFLV